MLKRKKELDSLPWAADPRVMSWSGPGGRRHRAETETATWEHRPDRRDCTVLPSREYPLDRIGSECDAMFTKAALAAGCS